MKHRGGGGGRRKVGCEGNTDGIHVACMRSCIYHFLRHRISLFKICLFLFLFQSPISAVVQSAAFALSNLARGEQIVAEELLKAGIAPILIKLLTPGNSSIDVAVEVAWVLSYLTSKPSCIPVFVSGGIVDILVHFLGSLAQETPHNTQAVTPMLRSLGKMFL